MKCLKCGKELEEPKKICPQCGSGVGDAADDEAFINSFFEAAEKEIRRKGAAKPDAVREGAAPDGSRLEKLFFSLMGFGVFAAVLSFINGNIISGAIAAVMILLFGFLYLVEAGIVGVRIRGLKIAAAIAALALSVPFFYFYNVNHSDNLTTEVNDRAADNVVTENAEGEAEGTGDENRHNEAEPAGESGNADDENVSADTDDKKNGEVADGVAYITPTGEKYHLSADCAGENAISGSKEELMEKYEPCGSCARK